MPLAIRVQFLAGYSGREWPPSPARIFKALVSSARAGWSLSNCKAINDSLCALEQQGWTNGTKLPEIVAPRAALRPPRQFRFVPNNSKNWPTERKLNPKKGIDLDKEPMVGWDIEAPSTVWYWWPDFNSLHVPVIRHVSRRVVSVGKGEDFALLDATDKMEMPLGNKVVHWKPDLSGTSDSSRASHAFLEVPEPGCLTVCDYNFARGLDELPLPAAGVRAVKYVSDARGAHREVPTFVLGLWRNGKRCSWDARLLWQVVEYVRNLLLNRVGDEVVDMLERNPCKQLEMRETVCRVLLGLDNCNNPVSEPHLAILPLPSVLGPYPDGRIRRIALTDFGANDNSTRHAIIKMAQVLLHGLELLDNGQGTGIVLNTEPDGQWLRAITKRSRTWATVTPLVQQAKELTSEEWKCLVQARHNAAQYPAKAAAWELRLRKRRLELIERSVQQAIDGQEARIKSIEFASGGYIAGVHVATQYRANGYLSKTPKLHVRVTFDRPVAGPLAVGRGRHVGFGVLWPIEEE